MKQSIQKVLEKNYGSDAATDEICAIFEAFMNDSLFSLERNIINKSMSDGDDGDVVYVSHIKDEFADAGIYCS